MDHYENSAFIATSPEKLFDFINNHANLSSHMNKPSWSMGGGYVETSFDSDKGQKIGSHIRLNGKAFGLSVFLDEVITKYDPPYKKEWETVGIPRLIVVGSYRMGVEINQENNGSRLKVFIYYELPPIKWIGRLLGPIYAKWCVEQMIKDSFNHFNESK